MLSHVFPATTALPHILEGLQMFPCVLAVLSLMLIAGYQARGLCFPLMLMKWELVLDSSPLTLQQTHTYLGSQ